LNGEVARHADILDRHEDVGEDVGVGVVECGLYATVCVGETSDIVAVITSVSKRPYSLCACSLSVV